MTDAFFAVLNECRDAVLAAPTLHHIGREDGERPRHHLQAAEKVVFVVLLRFANREAFERGEGLTVWPSQRRLAQAVGMAERTVRRILAALQAIGLLTVLRKGGGRVNTKYRLNRTWLSTLMAATSQDKHVTAGGTSESNLAGTTMSCDSTEETKMKDSPDTLSRAACARGSTDFGRSKEEAQQAAAARAATAASGSKQNSNKEDRSALASTSTTARRKANTEEFKRFKRSAEDDTFISKHCPDVADAFWPRWEAEFVDYRLAKGDIPADPHAAFRNFMRLRQKWAVEAREKARSTTRPSKLDAALNLARKLNPEG